MNEVDELSLLGNRRAELRAELRGVTEQIRVAALKEIETGATEVDVSRRGRVDRMTVRKWQGKVSPSAQVPV